MLRYEKNENSHIYERARSGLKRYFRLLQNVVYLIFMIAR